jgi:hypothetical protein
MLFQLFGQHKGASLAQWDDQYLVAGYVSGEVLILYRNHLGA